MTRFTLDVAALHFHQRGFFEVFSLILLISTFRGLYFQWLIDLRDIFDNEYLSSLVDPMVSPRKMLDKIFQGKSQGSLLGHQNVNQRFGLP